MPIGVLAMPIWFKYIINSVLNASRVDATNAFLDDIMVGGIGPDLWLCWEATLRVMYTLARFGFMLTLHKHKY